MLQKGELIDITPEEVLAIGMQELKREQGVSRRRRRRLMRPRRRWRCAGWCSASIRVRRNCCRRAGSTWRRYGSLFLAQGAGAVSVDGAGDAAGDAEV